ncbi:MAG: ATP-binding cassette domain-containing protein [Actinobacteria bacterium]|nr:ATP-binding cassette domain-containing protein [Actinomycetota bacterium]
MNRPSTVVASGLHKRFGARAALAGVSFAASGGVVALLGPNGAGKTTLLRTLATVLRPDHGSVLVDGLDVADVVQRTEVRRRLGYSPQEPNFAANATVFDVVDYFGIVKGHANIRSRHADVYRVLHEVGLSDRARDRVKDLSAGMRQRLSIAQAILGVPGLVLLDEPASGLDPEQRLMLRDRLSRLGERSTVIVSTHLTEEAAAFAQALHVIDQGRIVYTGTPAGLATTARGRVWLAHGQPVPGAGTRLSWRTPDGWYRCIGDPPAGATFDEPTLEDAYLLLVGSVRRPDAA